MKTKVIALVLVAVLLSSIFPINVLAENTTKTPIRTTPIRKGNTNNLVAHYKFDGNLNDSSSFGNDGKISKGNITYVKGKFGEAAKFDGNSYIEVLDNDSLDLDTKFTISLWLYKDEVYDYLPVLAKGLEGDVEMGIGKPYTLFHEAGGTQPTLQIHSPDDWQDMAPGDLSLNFNTLHMITITIDIPNKQVKHYVNGQLFQGENPEWYFTSDKLHRTNENLFIGGAKVEDDEVHYFHGFMDDLRIYNTVLSATEINSLYLAKPEESKEYVSMIITPDKMSIMKEKGVLNINALGVKPDGQKEDITTKAIYKSSNEQVATVDKQGKVTAISKGTATITVANGDLIKQILLTVK